MINQGITKAWKEINRIAQARWRLTVPLTSVDGTRVYVVNLCIQAVKTERQ